MNVLEKILEEIEDRKSYHEELLSQRDDYEIQKMYCDEELNWIREIICSHMNDVTDINVLSNWIPCSEKLPEETEYYLVQLSKKLPNEDYADRVVVLYDGEEKVFMCYEKLIVAWQPLPEPYKGEEAAG